jgi:hypothetical protein
LFLKIKGMAVTRTITATLVLVLRQGNVEGNARLNKIQADKKLAILQATLSLLGWVGLETRQ